MVSASNEHQVPIKKNQVSLVLPTGEVFFFKATRICYLKYVYTYIHLHGREKDPEDYALKSNPKERDPNRIRKRFYILFSILCCLKNKELFEEYYLKNEELSFMTW